MTRRLNWKDRSLSYLCRSFDQLGRGEDYEQVKPTIHIGFLNFSPVDDAEPEFYASYRLLNEKTCRPYSDKFILRVVNLTQINLATEEDRANGIDYWARLFTATSWKDIIMIAQNNSFLSAASQAIYESNADEITRQKCRAREEYNNSMEAFRKAVEKNKMLNQQLAEQKSTIAEQKSVIAEKDSTIAEKDSVIAEKDSVIAELKRLLATKNEE